MQVVLNPNIEKEELHELVIRLAENDNVDKTNLFKICKILWHCKYFILLSTLFFAFVAVYMTFIVMPERYTSVAVIEPTASSDKKLNMPKSLRLMVPIGSDNEFLVITNYLKCRTLKEWIITKYDLLPKLFPKEWDAIEKKWSNSNLEKSPTVMKAIQQNLFKDIYIIKEDESTTLVEIRFTDRDPKLAARIITGILEELCRYLEEDHITEAKRHRIFVEEQLAEAKNNLDFWEKQRPGDKYDANQIMREKKALEAVYTMLREQYEMAKIDEDKQVVAFKVLDEPSIPEIRSSPKRIRICLLTVFITLFFSTFISLLLKFYKDQKNKNFASS